MMESRTPKLYFSMKKTMLKNVSKFNFSEIYEFTKSNIPRTVY